MTLFSRAISLHIRYFISSEMEIPIGWNERGLSK